MKAENKKKKVEWLAKKYHIQAKIGNIHTTEWDTHYRNKVIVGFGKKKGKVYSGLYAPHTHHVVKNLGKELQPEIINKIIDRITELVQSMKIYLYNEDTGTGVLRHVLIRWAHATDEVMVVFVTGSSVFPSRRNMVHILTQEFPQIKTILQTINHRKTSVVMENEAYILYGKGTITDILCGKKITFGPDSFYQIHSQQCEVLYGLAKRMCHLKTSDTLLDTYCGVGTIGLTLASDCKQVTGVEINDASIHYAKINAKQNHINNIHFMHSDSTAFMKEAKRRHRHFDVIVLDPPRAGTTKDFIAAASYLNPREICYISCDPETLMRDLRYFQHFGYISHQIELVDMFPNTEHVETVVLMSRVKD